MSKDANIKNEPEKEHHQGDKEMPSSLPGQEISSDGKKMPLTEEQKKENAAKS